MLNSLIGIDQHLFLIINNLPHPWILVFLANLLSGAGSLGLVWFLIALLLIFFESHHPKLLLELLIAILGSTFLAQGLLKQIILRLRPDFILPDVTVYTKVNDYLSFPSNHAAVAFASAIVLSKIFPRGKVLLFTLATLIAFSRVYLGVHYPLDIVGGMILGMVVGKVVSYISSNPPAGGASRNTQSSSRQTRTIKMLLLVLITSFIVFPQKVSAKTVMEVKPDNINIYEESQVLGIENGQVEEKPTVTPLNIVEKILNIAVSGKKLLVEFTQNKENQGSQEVDEVLVKDGNNKNISVVAENGKVLLKEKLAEVSTSLPLTVKQSVGQFLAQTSTGQKIISYYPKDVIEKLRDKGVLEINNVPVKLELKEDGTRLVYVFNQEKAQKLFGIIPVKANIVTTVSAETGEVESKSSSWIYQILKNLLV